MASPAPATSTQATRRPVRPSCPPCARNIPQFTGILTINPDGSLFCDSLRTNRTLDLRDRDLFQAGPGRERDRHAGAGVRPADGDLGAADRLSRARGIRRAEIHPARIVQSQEIRRVSRETPRRTGSEILLVDRKGMVLVAPRGKDGPSRGRIDCEFRTVPVCDLTERRAVPRGDRRGMAEPRSGPSPAPLRSAMPGSISWSDDPRTVWSPPPTAAFTRIWRFSRWPRCCCSRAYGSWRPWASAARSDASPRWRRNSDLAI